jgi:hypothetical protein
MDFLSLLLTLHLNINFLATDPFLSHHYHHKLLTWNGSALKVLNLTLPGHCSVSDYISSPGQRNLTVQDPLTATYGHLFDYLHFCLIVVLTADLHGLGVYHENLCAGSFFLAYFLGHPESFFCHYHQE